MDEQPDAQVHGPSPRERDLRVRPHPLRNQRPARSPRAYEAQLRASSAYLEGERLRPSAEGKHVSRRDGEPRVLPGPFADKPLSSYFVLEAPPLDAAVSLARQCPASPGAELDVRPLMKGSLAADKANQRGRVFAFAALGSAPSEQGWVEVMDRIDESTGSHFPAGRFLGGVRL